MTAHDLTPEQIEILKAQTKAAVRWLDGLLARMKAVKWDFNDEFFRITADARCAVGGILHELCWHAQGRKERPFTVQQLTEARRKEWVRMIAELVRGESGGA